MHTDVAHTVTAVDLAAVDPEALAHRWGGVLDLPPARSYRFDYDAERQELISRQAKLAFPIRDGIPIMLPEEARPLVD